MRSDLVPALDYDATWSPDGRFVVFRSERDGTPHFLSSTWSAEKGVDGRGPLTPVPETPWARQLTSETKGALPWTGSRITKSSKPGAAWPCSAFSSKRARGEPSRTRNAYLGRAITCCGSRRWSDESWQRYAPGRFDVESLRLQAAWAGAPHFGRLPEPTSPQAYPWPLHRKAWRAPLGRVRDPGGRPEQPLRRQPHGGDRRRSVASDKAPRRELQSWQARALAAPASDRIHDRSSLDVCPDERPGAGHGAVPISLRPCVQGLDRSNSPSLAAECSDRPRSAAPPRRGYPAGANRVPDRFLRAESLHARFPKYHRHLTGSLAAQQANVELFPGGDARAPNVDSKRQTHRQTVTTSRGACRAARATDSRSRLPVGVRALTELGFAAAFQATSVRSERR